MVKYLMSLGLLPKFMRMVIKLKKRLVVSMLDLTDLGNKKFIYPL